MPVDEDEAVEEAVESDRSGDFIVIFCGVLVLVVRQIKVKRKSGQ